MERAGLMCGVQENRRRVYRLTSKGLGVVREVEMVNGSVQRFVARVFSGKNIGFCFFFVWMEKFITNTLAYMCLIF